MIKFEGLACKERLGGCTQPDGDCLRSWDRDSRAHDLQDNSTAPDGVSFGPSLRRRVPPLQPRPGSPRATPSRRPPSSKPSRMDLAHPAWYDSLSRAYRIIVRPTKAEEPSGFHFAVTHVLGLFCNASAKYAHWPLPRQKVKGAPGLAFETWDPCNRCQRETLLILMAERNQGWLK
jgi:hypothetical protein